MIHTNDPCTPDPLPSRTGKGDFFRRVLVIVIVLGIASALYIQGHDLSDAITTAAMAVVIASTAANTVVHGVSIDPASFA